jgi:hypothetical protein
MYHQFNIQQFYVLPTSVFMCSEWIWEQTAIISLYNINWLVFISNRECVFCAVRAGYLTFTSDFRRVRKIAKHDFQLCHVCPSVRMEQLRSHWTDFHKIWYLRIFRKSDEEIQISMQSGKNYEYFTWRPVYVYCNI